MMSPQNPPQTVTPSNHTPQTTPSEPNSQAPQEYRKNWPAWMRFLPSPRFRPEEPKLDAPLIEPDELKHVLADADPEAVKQIEEDIKFLEEDLLRLFRERDHNAKKHQNRYHGYQILYLVLAAVATGLGTAQVLALADNDRIRLAFFAMLETIIALLAVFLSTISGRVSPLPRWMDNRRRAEQLRREYFRFLMNLSPYTNQDSIGRQTLLAERAAEINRGVFPDESGMI
jgi:hypothetical protein